MVVIIVIGLLLSACDLQPWLQCELPEPGAEVVIASGAAAGTAGTVTNVQRLNGAAAVVLVGCFEWREAE